LRKLTDVHAGKTGVRIGLDSDMLFFRPPEELVSWALNPSGVCHLLDVAEAYGYARAVLGKFTRSSLPVRVNVGICGLKSEAIDFDQLEHWCASLLEECGSSYYLEQALTALLVAQIGGVSLPPEDYVVLPGRSEARRPRATLHHYVAESKAWYFRYSWRIAR
jgi:hypothetical protein